MGSRPHFIEIFIPQITKIIYAKSDMAVNLRFAHFVSIGSFPTGMPSLVALQLTLTFHTLST